MSFPENRYRVLVVEDDSEVRELVRYNLFQEGIETEASDEGLEALERLQRRSLDLVILDAALPDVSGLELCQKIRTCARIATLPILSAQFEFDRGRQGARPQYGRGRLRDQAVRTAGIDCAHQSSVAPNLRTRLVWGRDTEIEARTVDVHIRRLRAQIEADDSNPRIFVTVRGAGYRFDPDGLKSNEGIEQICAED
jgi:DNA-binding response OmpR family regulator